MERLNYFNPYSSKAGTHEDQLTRAYLVLLKHSFHAFAIFMNYCRSKHKVNLAADELPLDLNRLIEYPWQIETQKGNPAISSSWLISVLITDSSIKGATESIEVSDRNARYDGIITFGSHLSMIIENKPRSGNVWFAQLNPSKNGLSEETTLYENGVQLEWKGIIQQLNHVLEAPTLSGFERVMINDFLEFINDNFGFLNPYHRLDLCRGNHELIQRRIMNLLKSIVNDEGLVNYHQSWGYVIKVPYDPMREIGLILNSKDNVWWLELSFYFGATQSQSKAFYASVPNIKHLDSGGWNIYPNFHVAYQSSNLVWFKSSMSAIDYIDFWRKNIKMIYQRRRNEVISLFDWLQTEKVLDFSNDELLKLDDKFFKTAMPNLNVCPEVGIIFSIKSIDAERMDRSDGLAKEVKNRILEGLKVISKDGHEFLKP